MFVNIVLLGLDFGSNNMGCAALSYSFLNILEHAGEKLKCKINAISINYNDFEYNSEILRVTNEKITLKNLKFHKHVFSYIKQADYIFDFTGGDSFTDLYGTKRFLIESYFKFIPIVMKRKLVLGPQTFGPFKGKINRWIAKIIIKKSFKIYTRDKLSLAYLKNTFKYTPNLTTDIAFGLPSETIYIEHYNEKAMNVGINVSGLLWNGGYTGKNELGIKLEYRKFIIESIEKMIKRGYNIWLIPHVITEDKNHPENDMTPIWIIKERYPEVHIIENISTPMVAKGYIKNMDFFVGSRMHATVAAFSNGIPTVPVAYSRKFQGLYESIGYNYIIDAKTCNNSDAIVQLFEYIDNAKKLRENVVNSCNKAFAMNSSFNNDIIKMIKSKLTTTTKL